jgi:hypothetical protein
MIATDAIFVRSKWAQAGGPSAHDLDALAALIREIVTEITPLRGLQLAFEPSIRVIHCYAQLQETTMLGNEACAVVERELVATAPAWSEAQVSRLENVFDTTGVSAATVSAFHYVVETDVDEGWWPEFTRWYDEEHMPGLAAVPGCVHAVRYVNHDYGPRSHASYLLVTEDTKGSPPWMLMTDSAWSSRVRPHFVNTIRTMMRSLRA